MSVTTINGDLLDVKHGVIVHQLNCMTVRPHGLSDILAKKFPYCNVYSERKEATKEPGQANRCVKEDEGIPGMASIRHNSFRGDPIVVGLLAQYGPGKPGRWTPIDEDTAKMRGMWFAEALYDMHRKIENFGPIYFPWMIGCGLAGGNWDGYEAIIEAFAKNTGRDVFIVKLPNQ